MSGLRRQQAGSPEHYLSVSFVISAHDTNQTSKQIGPARVWVLNPGRLKTSNLLWTIRSDVQVSRISVVGLSSLAKFSSSVAVSR